MPGTASVSGGAFSLDTPAIPGTMGAPAGPPGPRNRRSASADTAITWVATPRLIAIRFAIAVPGTGTIATSPPAPHAFGQRARRLAVQARQHAGELLAAVARRQRPGRGQRPQHAGHRLQYLVASRGAVVSVVAVAVVVVLEPARPATRPAAP